MKNFNIKNNAIMEWIFWNEENIGKYFFIGEYNIWKEKNIIQNVLLAIASRSVCAMYAQLADYWENTRSVRVVFGVLRRLVAHFTSFVGIAGRLSNRLMMYGPTVTAVSQGGGLSRGFELRGKLQK